MQIIDKQERKRKAAIISAIMKNDNLAKKLADSFSSPSGSTNNKKASAILKSFNKSYSRYDGQGGTGALDLGIEGPQPQLQNQSANQTVAPQPEAPKQTIFVKGIDDLLPSGNLQALSGFTGMKPTTLSTMPTDMYNPSTDLFGGKLTSSVRSVGDWFKNFGKGSQPATSQSLKDQLALMEKNPTAYGEKSIQNVKDKIAELDAPKIPSYTPGGMSMLPSATQTATPSTLSKYDNLMAYTQVPEDKPTSTQSETDGSYGEYDTSDIQDILNNYGEGGLDAWYQGLDQSLQSYYEPVYSAVKNRVGPETFAYQTMSNKADLAKLLGVSEDSLANMPTSGLLSDQLIDLRNTIDKEVGLTDQLNKLTQLRNQGYNLKSNMDSYVRGQDEYLGEIDKMLDNTKDQIAYMDTSNPYVAQRMQNYTTYLTTLQGRQNQRYIDFLNSSIEQYNTRIQQESDLYDTAVSRAEQLYSEQALLTTESYNNMKNMLKEIHSSVSSVESSMNDAYEYQLDITKKQYDNAKSVLELQKLQDELMYGSTDWLAPKNDILDDYLYSRDYEGDVDYSSIDNYDPYEFMSQAVAAQQSPEMALNYYIKQHKSALENSVARGNFLEEYGKESQSIINLLDGLENLEPEQATKNASIADGLIDMVENGLRSGIKSYLSDTESKILDNIRTSIEGLTKHGFLSASKPKYSRDKFIDKYSESIGDMAPTMYDYYTSAMSGADGKLTPKEVFTENELYYPDMTDEQLKSALTNRITDYLIGSY